MLYGSLTPLLVTTLLTYLVFVFVSEQLNPFSKPKSFLPGGSRWRRGWFIGGVFFLCTLTGLLVGEKFPEYRRIAIAVSTAVFVTFWLLSSAIRFISNRVEHRQPDAEERTVANEPTSATLAVAESPIHAPAVYEPITPQRIKSKRAISKRVENAESSEFDFIDARSSEEHALERELEAATAHIDPETADLDQSIAEAHFQDVLSIHDIAEEFSQPEFALADNGGRSTVLKDSSLDKYYSQVETGPSNSLENSLGEISYDAYDIESEIASKALEEIDVDSDSLRSEQIQQLSIEKQSLIESKEALVSEVNELSLKVKKSEAVARKNQALKEQATELKNKALAFAAMERKKRKMTEIRAGKAILKLQRSVRLLERQDHA